MNGGPLSENKNIALKTKHKQQLLRQLDGQ